MPRYWKIARPVLSRFSRVGLFVTPWTAAHQSPLSMGLPWQESWGGLPRPSPGDLLDLGLLCLWHWKAGSLPLAPPIINHFLRFIIRMSLEEIGCLCFKLKKKKKPHYWTQLAAAQPSRR